MGREPEKGTSQSWDLVQSKRACSLDHAGHLFKECCVEELVTKTSSVSSILIFVHSLVPGRSCRDRLEFVFLRVTLPMQTWVCLRVASTALSPEASRFKKEAQAYYYFSRLLNNTQQAMNGNGGCCMWDASRCPLLIDDSTSQDASNRHTLACTFPMCKS